MVGSFNLDFLGHFSKRLIIGSLMIFSLFAFPIRGHAAPQLSDIQGTIQNGSNITIKGSGFGSTGPTMVLFDDFEGGSNGARIKTGSGSAKVGTWAKTEGSVVYSNAASVSGSLAFRADMSSGWRNLAEAVLPNGGNTDIFISWWLYIPSSDYYPGESDGDTNWKQLWIQGAGTTDDDLVFPTFNGSQAYFFGNDSCVSGGSSPGSSLYFGNWHFRKGQWHRYWGFVHGKADSSGSIYLYELDPSSGYSALYEDSGQKIQCGSGDKFERVDINGYGRQTSNSHPMFDDVYIAVGSNARARIELGDRATYTSCTNMAVLTPVSWNSSQIVATVRTGSFKSGQSAYLFVFDANGAVSSGKAVTIGQISEGGSTPPTDDAPSINITNPTSSSSYTTSSSSINLAGSASDDNGVSKVTWNSSRGGSGTANYSSGNWSASAISLQSGTNAITVTARDTAGQTTTDTLNVTFNAPTPPQDDSPTVRISSPTTSSSYTTDSTSINLAGTASDDNGVSSVTWSNNRGGNGSASYSSGNWSASGIGLQSGTNVITVTARDTADQTETDTLSVTYEPTSPPSVPEDSAWNAESNIGGGTWYNSVVTYCVRILIPGEQVAQSGNKIKLGFQGRNSGSYTIRSVSIAQRDTNGNVGDIIDSTWKKVTFDKKAETYMGEPLMSDSWESYKVLVPQNTEKISNPIPFNIIQGKDYYVTFKIESPAVYQNPPSGYSELFFQSADHTQDLDWSGKGFSTTQDYHALSNIYITDEAVSPSSPSFQ